MASWKIPDTRSSMVMGQRIYEEQLKPIIHSGETEFNTDTVLETIEQLKTTSQRTKDQLVILLDQLEVKHNEIVALKEKLAVLERKLADEDGDASDSPK